MHIKPNYNIYVGCNMSPLLFSIFLNVLGKKLNETGLGIPLGDINVSAIFFADDIILISKNHEDLSKLMKITQDYFKSHQLTLSTEKSKVMPHDANINISTFSGNEDHDELSLEQIMSFKYLGVPLSSSPRKLFYYFNEQIKKRCKMYLPRVLSLVKKGPDQAKLAYTLWVNIALPSILYGAEVIPIQKTVIKLIEKCQNSVARFILQIPKGSAAISGNIDCGFKPIWSIIAEKMLLYANSVMKKDSSNWAKLAFMENVLKFRDGSYYKTLLEYKRKTFCENC